MTSPPSLISSFLSELPVDTVTTAEQADEFVADNVRSLREQTSISLVAHSVGLVVVALMYARVANPWVLAAWLLLGFVLFAARAWLHRHFPRGEAASLTQLKEWRRQWNVVALATAASWGLAVLLFYDLGTDLHLVALVLMVQSYVLAGVHLLASQPRVYLAFATLGTLPVIARVLADTGSDYHLQLAAILLLVFLLSIGLAAVHRRSFESMLRVKLSTQQLAEQLRTEKLEADEARRAAEVANRSKTQFFAAASHDLRQPLHALGLFAEALRQRSHDVEVAQLVNSINSSVDALEGLFSELLDITRIDTGGVEVRAQHMHVGDLFSRLRLSFEPVAFEKGLALRFRGGRHFAFADPVLVDRILRNLLSNAIRYTHDGSVLVSCRPRGGRLLLQVWDTGVGIRPAEQARIFDEFYQVPDDIVLAPHQRRGLGLGLAIVKRLAALMNAPLALASEPGRGSVFTMELPMGRARQPSATSQAAVAPLGLTLDRRLIVVVEDEPAVRAAIEVLLKSWGASVICFETAAASEAWAGELPPDAPRPDLLMVDYRLEPRRTGVDAIEGLRRRFGSAVPAILVTGSTMTGHEVDAQRHNFHILTKPVVPHRLRAMIAFKLGMR